MSDEQAEATIRRLTIANRRLEEQNAVFRQQLRAAQARQTPALWSKEALWDMYSREHKERIRLLRANRKLTEKILRRARTIGDLRTGIVELIKTTSGDSIKLPL